MAERIAKPSRWRDTLGLVLLALALRLLVVAWAATRIPPTADGTFYHLLAERIAAGEGYTWLWPNGDVTFVAHYPVGYPAMLAAGYAALSATPLVAMLLNALLGVVLVVAVHRSLRPRRRRRAALLAGGIAALHPAFLAYTPALMTEGPAATLIALALWLVVLTRDARGSRRWGWLGLLGLVLGLATLVRPQCVLFAPLLGALALRPERTRAGWLGWRAAWRYWRRPLLGAALVSMVTLGSVAPWTLRNCQRMDRCALVSVNGGWNLLIGTQPEGHGGWSELRTPSDCRDVFDEAQKDLCFERAARRTIRAQPWAWLRLAPAKLAVTFDYCGAGGWYLHAANAAAFDARTKLTLGVVETAVVRLVLLLALLACLPTRLALALRKRNSDGARGLGSPRSWGARRGLLLLTVMVGVGCCLSRPGWLAYVALVLALLLHRRRPWLLPAHYAAVAGMLAITIITHAVFFGSGRYQLVVLALPLLLVPDGLSRCVAALRAARERLASS